MKKQIIITLLLCGLFTVPLTASTFRVNNKLADNASAKIYSTLQKAHDAANNGDTIMVEGSSVLYSDIFTCTKRLVIKGPGYFLDENPGISANKLSANINGQIIFNSGSTGSLIMGIESTYLMSIYDDNITIRRCNFKASLQMHTQDNITISECIFEEGVQLSGEIETNLIVLNNIIKAGNIYFQAGSTGVFLNNILTAAFITIPTGFDMKNNILVNSTTANISLPLIPDPDVCNNISIGSHFGTANNNKANVSEGSLFLGTLSESTDGSWQLKTASPAIGAGEGGIDGGAFGGPHPYILSGVPTGPVIYQLNVSSFSTTDNKLPVTIKVKSY
jgi:hypothetical protein